MRARRPPSQPPVIQGYEYLRLIGSGGFADVFLYQEFRPRRQVAIKVLLPQWSEDATREAFAAEADLMATVSSHPSIVTIFDSDITEDGRLFLAMEYCSRPNLSARYKKERLGIAETLRIGIQIAGAVETAHRSGIVHRDIKPANILVTDYGHPALTDFGISATIEQSEAGADGMSVPWSPPENLTAAPRSGVTSDVWSLAATIYTLLTGRSPFEIPGGTNTQRALIDRITSAPLPPLERGDVPASLERVLEVAMAKEPQQRYPSMLDLGRALQQVQSGLNLATTPIDIIDDGQVATDSVPGLLDEDEDVDGGTRMRIASDRFHPGYGVVHATGPGRPAAHTGAATAAQVDSISGVGSNSTSTSYGSIAGVPYLPHATGSTGGTSAPAPAPAQRAPAPPLPYAPASPGSVVPGAPSSSAHPVGSMGGGYATAPGAASGTSGPATRRERAAGPTPRWRQPLAVVVVVAVALGVGGGMLVYDRLVASTTRLPGSTVPSVTELEATATADSSAATFAWVNPDPQEGDFYAYRPVDAEGVSSAGYRKTTAQSVSVNTFSVDDPCLEVVLVRDGRLSEESTSACL